MWTAATGMATALFLLVLMLIRRHRYAIIQWRFPVETSLLGHSGEQRRAVDAALSAIGRRLTTWVVVFAFAVALIVVAELLKAAVGWAAGITATARGVDVAEFVYLVTPMVFAPLLYVPFEHWMRRFLRDYLIERGVAICRGCGYDLRGSVPGRCPECGRVVEESVTRGRGP